MFWLGACSVFRYFFFAGKKARTFDSNVTVFLCQVFFFLAPDGLFIISTSLRNIWRSWSFVFVLLTCKKMFKLLFVDINIDVSYVSSSSYYDVRLWQLWRSGFRKKISIVFVWKRSKSWIRHRFRHFCLNRKKIIGNHKLVTQRA